MATNEANNKSAMEPWRPLANFPTSIRGEYFLSFSLNDSELKGYAKAIEQPKEDIRRLIVSPNMDSNAKLRLINSVYRLGLKYLFLEEIECELDKLF
ncbi:germacrene A synthase, partial [Tanacetum coccineum]